MVPTIRKIVCNIFVLAVSYPALAYYYGEKADDFSEKVPVFDSHGVKYCYSAALGGIGSVFSNQLYLYLDSCDNASAVRYDIYGRLSVNYDGYSYCLTAPRDVVDTNRESGWLKFSRCKIGSRYQSWKIMGSKIFLRGTRFVVQHYNDALNRYFYGIMCRVPSQCYYNHLAFPGKLAAQYSYPTDINVPLKLQWRSLDGSLYNVNANNSSTAAGSEQSTIDYDPLTHRLTYQSYHVGIRHGIIYHIPQIMCLASPLVGSNSGGSWGWARWERCGAVDNSSGAVVHSQQWFPVKINSTGFFSEYDEKAAVHWLDSDGNYLAVSGSGYNFGTLYVLNKSEKGYSTDLSPFIFYVSSTAGQDWLDFESQSFFGVFRDKGKYCNPYIKILSPDRDDTFGKYFTILKSYAMREDGMSECKSARNKDNIICFIPAVNALFIVTHPVGAKSLYPPDYDGTLLDFVNKFFPSLNHNMNQELATDADHIIWVGAILDKFFPGKVHSLSKDVGVTISELKRLIYQEPKGTYFVMAEYKFHYGKRHAFLVIRESSSQFQAIHILDTNISHDSAAVRDFTDAFYGKEDLDKFFYTSHLNVDNIFIFRVADDFKEGNLFYPLRNCSEENNVSYKRVGGDFSLSAVHKCAVMSTEGKLVDSRCVQ